MLRDDAPMREKTLLARPGIPRRINLPGYNGVKPAKTMEAFMNEAKEARVVLRNHFKTVKDEKETYPTLASEVLVKDRTPLVLRYPDMAQGSYVGRIQLSVGGRPPNPYPRDAEFYSFWKTNVASYAPNAGGRTRVDAHSKTVEPHLAAYLGYSSVHEVGFEAVRWAVSLSGELHLSCVPAPSGMAVRSYGINVDAYSGLISERIYARRKGLAVNWSTSCARVVLNACSRRFQPIVCPYAVGGRDKPGDVTPYEKPKARLIMMADLVETQVSQTLSLPVASQLEREINPVFMGQSFYRGRYAEFYDYFRDCRFTFAADMRAFDTTLPEYVLLAATSIIRACYPASERTDNLVLSVFSGLAHSYIVAAGGHLYRKTRGIPSGHPWTSLVGSLSNWVVLRAVCCILYGPTITSQMKVATCGDDFVIGFPHNAPIMDPAVFNAGLRFYFGMQIKLETARMTLGGVIGRSLDDSVPFLAHYMVNGYPERAAPEVVDSLLFPHNRKHSWRRRLEVALAFLYDTPCSSMVIPWLIDWIKVCFKANYGERFFNIGFREWMHRHWSRAWDLTVNTLSDVAEDHIVPENLRIFGLRRMPIKISDSSAKRPISMPERNLFIRSSTRFPLVHPLRKSLPR